LKIVMKFGGSSIDNSQKMLRAAEIVASRVKSNDSVIVVVSALAEVTDNLISAAKLSIKDINSTRRIIDKILLKHLNILDKISNQNLRILLENSIRSSICELNNTLNKLVGMNNVPMDVLDNIVSFGERLSAPIFSSYLEELGINSKPLNGWEAGIITDENYGSANPIPSVSKLIKEKIEPIIDSGIVPVVTGFIGLSVNGKITTLGRGGSDYTASLVASSLIVDELWLWTDVDGLMTADPRIVSKAKPIKLLSYNEAIELCFFGAKKLHHKTFEPIMDLGIPIRIKNIMNPDSEGTLIVKDKLSSSARAICVLNGSIIITIENVGFHHKPLNNIISALNGRNIKYDDISMIAVVGVNFPLHLEIVQQIVKLLISQGVDIQAVFSLGNSTILLVSNGLEGKAANLVHDIVISGD